MINPLIKLASDILVTIKDKCDGNSRLICAVIDEIKSQHTVECESIHQTPDELV